MQKILTKLKKNEGFISIETIMIGGLLISLAGFIVMKTNDSGEVTAQNVQVVLNHDSTFINETTKNEIIGIN